MIHPPSFGGERAVTMLTDQCLPTNDNQGIPAVKKS
jgi:hypothetical protein